MAKPPQITTSPIRNLRKARGMSQTEVASLLKVEQSTFARWERGEVIPSEDMRALLATRLGTSVDVLWPDLAEHVDA